MISNSQRHLVSFIDDTFFKFPVTRSQVGYKSKEEAKKHITLMKCVKTPISIKQFVKLISNGYAFSISNVCSDTKMILLKKYFDATNLVVFDIDHTNLKLESLLDYIRTSRPDINPTIAYESYSCDNETEKYKYRLIYVFNEGLGRRKRKKLYTFLKEVITEVCLENDKDSFVEFDNAMFTNETQRSFATNSDNHLVTTTGLVYKPMFQGEQQSFSLYDIREILTSNIDNRVWIKYYNGQMPVEDLMSIIRRDLAYIPDFFNKVSEADILDAVDNLTAKYYASQDNITDHYADSVRLKELMDELSGKHAIHHSEFLKMHSDEFTIYTKSNIELPKNKCIAIPENYFNVDWCKQWKDGKTVKIKDGQRRRTKLTFLAEGLRLINPDIKVEELFYNLVAFKLHYIDNNSDDKITTYELRNIAVNAVKKAMLDIKIDILCMPNRPKHLGAGSLKGSSRKKQDLSKRKKQDRSEWHSLVKDGKTLKEIQVLFPEVKASNYRKVKSMIKKQLNV